jgi:hypothetical protein
LTTRYYSSFLLRFWLVSNTAGGETALDASAPRGLSLQIQHLQTGATWRLNSLEELNDVLVNALNDGQGWALPGEAGGDKSLPAATPLDGSEVES